MKVSVVLEWKYLLVLTVHNVDCDKFQCVYSAPHAYRKLYLYRSTIDQEAEESDKPRGKAKGDVGLVQDN